MNEINRALQALHQALTVFLAAYKEHAVIAIGRFMAEELRRQLDNCSMDME